jgi:hypothetical protein
MDNAIIARKVAARAKSAIESATPILDKLFKNEAKLAPFLKSSANRLSDLADEVEKAIAKLKPDLTKDIADKAMKVAYKLLDPFRPFLNNGDKELRVLSGATFDAAKQARQLYVVIHEDLPKAYAAVHGAMIKEEPEAIRAATHELAMAAIHAKLFYNQYVEAYGR